MEYLGCSPLATLLYGHSIVEVPRVNYLSYLTS